MAKKWKQNKRQHDYTEKKDTQYHPFLPAASPAFLAPSHWPPLFSTFSHTLWKSGTVIKAISNVYSGDVQYKA